MRFTCTKHFVGIWTVIFAIALSNASVATEDKRSHHSSTDAEAIYVSYLVIFGSISFAKWLSPLDDWQAEISKLKKDVEFIERWMLIHDDSTSLEKGRKAIVKIQERQKALEKKYNRWKWFYYPTVGIVGASAMSLFFWLARD